MGSYSGGLIIGRIFAFEIWGAYFWDGLFFGELIIGILPYVNCFLFCYITKETSEFCFLESQNLDSRETKFTISNSIGKSWKASSHKRGKLRKHCCPECFPICAQTRHSLRKLNFFRIIFFPKHFLRKHFLGPSNKKCFWTFSDASYFRNKCCFRAQTGRETLLAWGNIFL